MVLVIGTLVWSGCRTDRVKPVAQTCEQALTIGVDGNDWKVPFCTQPLSPAQVKVAVILVPGASRDATGQFENLVEAAEETLGDASSAALMALQFLVEEDVDRHKLDEDYVYWEAGWEGWKYGFDAWHGNEESAELSSFQVMDSVIMRSIRDYPALERIVLFGHSAGGQFMHRYAAINRVHDLLPEDIEIRYIAANPSSWLYFNDERIQPDGKFAALSPADLTECPKYNEYKFGLDDLGPCRYCYETGATIIRTQYPFRKVYLLAGSEDNNPNDNSMDQSCHAHTQGEHRLERAENYWAYLQHFYGAAIQTTQQFFLLEDVEHSSGQVLRNETTRQIMFEGL